MQKFSTVFFSGDDLSVALFFTYFSRVTTTKFGNLDYNVQKKRILPLRSGKNKPKNNLSTSEYVWPYFEQHYKDVVSLKASFFSRCLWLCNLVLYDKQTHYFVLWLVTGRNTADKRNQFETTKIALSEEKWWKWSHIIKSTKKKKREHYIWV